MKNILKKIILATNEKTSEIKEALNLISCEPESGKDITWTSSDPEIIAPSGRVIRPRWDEKAEKVTLTAKTGEESYSFNFTVLPDTYIGDPLKTTDESFFGVYKNGICTSKGQLDYEGVPKLNKVEKSAKSGDYQKAKEELLLYMREKIKSSKKDTAFKPEYLEFTRNEGSEVGNNFHYLATGSVDTSEYKRVEFELDDIKNISVCQPRAYNLISKYRDSVEITLAGLAYPDESMRPAVILTVNGTQKIFPATKAAQLRGGDYMETSYGILDELKVKMFGEIIGNETYRSLLEFDFSSLKKSDVVEKATLVIYAKKSNSYSEPKEFYVMREPDVSWSSETVNWLSLKGLYYNFSGIDGGNPWKKQPGCDIEYSFQTNRFPRWLYLASEYYQNGDEKYAYSVIYHIMSFSRAHAILETYEDCNRLLDSNLRLGNWIHLFKLVINSKYMTPDICTAMLKRFYEATTILTDEDGLLYNSSISRYGNVVKASVFFNEYTDSKRCLDFAIDWFERSLDHFFFEDGAYFEDTCGYNWVIVRSYLAVKQIMLENGIKMSEKFDKTLRNAVYYNLLMRGPNGESFGYGDALPGKKDSPNAYPEVVKWYNDDVLKFLDTFGEEGTEPTFTSKLFPNSTYVLLRSDWSKDAHMLFTTVRNGTLHGHNDDNGIILFGYGRNLLTDAGYATYTPSPERTLAVSSLMHNTVEINGISQKKSDHPTASTKDGYGTTDAFKTNGRFDFVSQSSRTYEHIENVHKRTITFIKPDFYIVSDLMTPKDKTSKNTYKQVWHMAPDAKLSISDGKIYSNYEGDGNLIISDADNTELLKDVGIYTISYGSYVNPEYAYYYKEGYGDITFDTVLLPYKKKGSDLSIERIVMDGVKEGEATALKINIINDEKRSAVYYMLNYENCNERTFGKYKTDAKMAIVIEDEKGTPKEFILTDGSYIKSSDNESALSIENKISDVFIEVNKSDFTVISNDNGLKKSQIKISF